RGPFAIRRRTLGAVERAVDLDRSQVLGGIGELARMRQAFGIEHAPPGLVGPAANSSVDIALSLRHPAVMSVKSRVTVIAGRSSFVCLMRKTCISHSVF